MNLINQPIYIFLKDITTLILTTAGIIIASSGLSTWKKQIKGGKEFEIGYNLNYAVLKMRGAIKDVRNPFVWNNETEDAEKNYREKYPESSNEDQKKNASSYVYVLRWKKISEASTEMESHLLGAEILWGKEVLTKIKPINNCIKKLNMSIYRHFKPELRSKLDDEDIIFNTGTEENPDKFSIDVDKAVEEIHNYIESKKIL